MKMRYILLLFTLPLLFPACKPAETVVRTGPVSLEPFYTSMDKLVTLRAGMSREEARQTLGVYPFDIMHNQFDGCEIHHYLYRTRMRELPLDDYSQSLIGGTQKLTDRNDLFLIFRDNGLETFFSGSGKEARPLLQLKDDLMFVCNNSDFIEGPRKGCTDTNALNYDPKATTDDGTCNYCPCGQVRNPWYDERRKCGERCMTELEYARRLKAMEGSEDCNPCDLLQRGLDSKNGKVDIHLNLDGSGIQFNNARPAPPVPATTAPSQPESVPVARSLFRKQEKPAPAELNASVAEPTDQWGRTYHQNMDLYRKRRRQGGGLLVPSMVFIATGLPLTIIGASSDEGALIGSGSGLLAASIPLLIGSLTAFKTSRKYLNRANALTAPPTVSAGLIPYNSFSGPRIEPGLAFGITFKHTF